MGVGGTSLGFGFTVYFFTNKIEGLEQQLRFVREDKENALKSRDHYESLYEASKSQLADIAKRATE